MTVSLSNYVETWLTQSPKQAPVLLVFHPSQNLFSCHVDTYALEFNSLISSSHCFRKVPNIQACPGEAVGLSVNKAEHLLAHQAEFTQDTPPSVKAIFACMLGLWVFVVCHWGSKLHSSDSIHSPRIAEPMIILAVWAAPGLVAMKNGGRPQIFQTCFAA